MAKSSNVVDLKLVLFHETPKAWLVGLLEDKDEAVWVPKSAGEIYDKVGIAAGYPIHEFTLNEWICLEKELI
jgi:hypothetical protein